MRPGWPSDEIGCTTSAPNSSERYPTRPSTPWAVQIWVMASAATEERFPTTSGVGVRGLGRRERLMTRPPARSCPGRSAGGR